MWDKKKPNAPELGAWEPKNWVTRKQGTEALSSSDGTADRATGWLGPSVQVKGDISGTDDLLIDGSIEGLIQVDGQKVTVGPTAKITADIRAHNVVVYGYVKGNVRATGRIEIKKDGSVTGNLTTAEIAIEDGADFKGSLEIIRGEAKEADEDLQSRAASA
jgi:cytoskeletal protein CcmA (bactofilin family)